MDRLGADFFRCVDMIEDRLDCVPAVIQLPVGAEGNYRGIIDLTSMKATLYHDDLGEKLRRRRHPRGAERAGRGVPREAARRAHDLRRRPHGKSARRRGHFGRRHPPRAAQGHLGEPLRADPQRFGLQEQGRPAHARRGRRLPALADRPPADRGHEARQGRAARAQARRRRALLRPGVQDHDRPLRRQAHVPARLLGHPRKGRHRDQHHQGHEARAPRATAAHAREQPRRPRHHPHR